MKHIFITGFNRSGTSLLSNLLVNQPDVFVSNQPFFNLLKLAKENFHEMLGLNLNLAFPFINYFDFRKYDYQDFSNFLINYVPKFNHFIRELKNEDNYSGQYRSLNSSQIIDLNSLKFPELLKCLWKKYIPEDCNGLKLIGSKEVFCEEFIPFLLKQNTYCILVVRDPRDVLASMNFGTGNNYSGSIKPSLFNIRNWRKSIAFGIELAENQKFLMIRYEDLVNKPSKTLQQIGEITNTPISYDRFDGNTLFDEFGNPWSGNSSFRNSRTGISQKSVGKFEKIMNEEQIKFIETYCQPEMLLLNYYPKLISPTQLIDSMRRIDSDPFDWNVSDNRFKSYINFHAKSEEEKRRLGELNSSSIKASKVPHTSNYFLSSKVRSKLAEILKNSYKLS